MLPCQRTDGNSLARSDLACVDCGQHLDAQVAQDVFADLENPTADELRALPQGKKTHAHRSSLHDDISVVIVVFGSAVAMRERYAPMRARFYFRSVETAGWLAACLSLCRHSVLSLLLLLPLLQEDLHFLRR